MNTIGNNPYTHLYYLDIEQNRIKVLQTLLVDVIKPGMSVLDIGTGSLGILAILAAKLGATRVVGVDIVECETVRAIVKENNVDVDIHHTNINNLNTLEKFDVIVGMIYDDEPWVNETQCQTFKTSVEKFSHANTILIPDNITYDVTLLGVEPKNQNLTSRIQAAEQLSGVSLQHLNNPTSAYFKAFLFESPLAIVDNLSATQPFVDIKYNKSTNQFPRRILFDIQQSGFATHIEWTLNIKASEQVVRTAKFKSVIVNRKYVNARQQVEVVIDQNWCTNQVRLT